ncbi:hypothetical protein CDV31_006826 [Fusarium ambrosium]|uniref:Zn(2)-C6 fungal-type domain-containing protein n=1 Tax=Fusarium ambrosium TaxID=131363 RepID=A0A428UAP4_9HYPO|nr:hypothetical protein CDV31_006826 [Fusarium ambrosium]
MRRLGYRKSKNGCLQCKQRRVKCDEKIPCSACARHSLRCSLQDVNKPSKATKIPHSVPSPEPPSQLSSAASDAESTSTDGFPFLSAFSGGCFSTGESNGTRDMELIHHYTATGYLAISSAKTTRDTLQHTLYISPTFTPRLDVSTGTSPRSTRMSLSKG